MQLSVLGNLLDFALDRYHVALLERLPVFGCEITQNVHPHDLGGRTQMQMLWVALKAL